MEKLGSIPRTPTLRVLAAQQDLAFCFVYVKCWGTNAMFLLVRVHGTRYAGGKVRADSLDCSRVTSRNPLTPLFSILGALVTFGHGLFSSSCSLLGSRDRVRATALWHFTHVRVL